jgi:hypothetical protein
VRAVGYFRRDMSGLWRAQTKWNAQHSNPCFQQRRRKYLWPIARWFPRGGRIHTSTVHSPLKLPIQTRRIISNLEWHVSSGVEIQLLKIFCLLLALSTRSSRSTCCPKYNAMFPAETFKIIRQRDSLVGTMTRLRLIDPEFGSRESQETSS